MSGECPQCGEDAFSCDCSNLKVWAQMFFDDGSVSQGLRVSACVFENQSDDMRQIAIHFLDDLNRNEGFLIVWGAGEMFYRHYYMPLTTFSSSEL